MQGVISPCPKWLGHEETNHIRYFHLCELLNKLLTAYLSMSSNDIKKTQVLTYRTLSYFVFMLWEAVWDPNLRQYHIMLFSHHYIVS